MTHRSLLMLFALAAASVACSRGNRDFGAIESLSQQTLSPEYDAAFWTDQASNETETWRRAVELCRDTTNQQHPNCTVVLSTAFIQGLEKATDGPFPEYGTGSGSTGVPQGLQDPLEPDLDPDDRPTNESGDG